MRDLKEVLEQNKEKYIEELKNLVGIDTHDLGHGIDGCLLYTSPSPRDRG